MNKLFKFIFYDARKQKIADKILSRCLKNNPDFNMYWITDGTKKNYDLKISVTSNYCGKTGSFVSKKFTYHLYIGQTYCDEYWCPHSLTIFDKNGYSTKMEKGYQQIWADSKTDE